MSADATGFERVGTVTGDRRCTKCGYNLIGQPIVREPHYEMLLVRCPECAQPAAIQEYPALARAARWWARLLAALWLAAILGAWILSGFAVMGIAAGATSIAATRGQEMIAERYDTWQKAQQPAPSASKDREGIQGGAGPTEEGTAEESDTDAGNGAESEGAPVQPPQAAGPGGAGPTEEGAAGEPVEDGGEDEDEDTDTDTDPDTTAVVPALPPLPGGVRVIQSPGTVNQTIIVTPGGTRIISQTGTTLSFSTYWEKVDRSAFVRDAGGLRRLVAWEVAWFWLPMAILVGLIGCFWAVVVAGRRRGLLLVGLSIIVLGGIFVAIQRIGGQAMSASWPWAAASDLVAPLVMPLTLAIMAVGLFVGLMVGRPLTRLLVRFALPPRIAGWLGVLWEEE